MALCLLSFSLTVFLLYYYATILSKPTDASDQLLYLVGLNVDRKQIRAAALIGMLLVPFLRAIPMALMQRPLEDFVFYGIAAIILVSGFMGLCLFDSNCGMVCYLWHIPLILSVCSRKHKHATHMLNSSALYLSKLGTYIVFSV